MDSMQQLILPDVDAEGAALGHIDPSLLTVPQLKLWLKWHGLPCGSGHKRVLMQVVKDAEANNVDGEIIDPDYPYYTQRKLANSPDAADRIKKYLALKPPFFPDRNIPSWTLVTEVVATIN